MNLKRICFCISFILLQAISSQAQNFVLYSDKTFGGNKGEGGSYICYDGNNYFILIGASLSNISGDKTDTLCNPSSNLEGDIWILKIDTAFNIFWDKSIGGSQQDVTPWVVNTYNKGLILSCYSKSDSSCEKSENNRSFPISHFDYWICAIDSNGNKIWDKTIGGSSDEMAPKIIKLSTRDFIICGGSSSPVSGDKTVPNFGAQDYWAVKIDSLGNKIWDKVYGGSGPEGSYSTGAGFSLLSCSDGDFIIAGITFSPAGGSISQSGYGIGDVWLIKVDSAGNKIWDRRYGGSGNDACNHIIQTTDNGYIICGVTNSPQGGDISDPPRGMGDIWVLKLDSIGNKQWDKRYGGSDDELGTYIQASPEGGYWIAGSTVSDSSFEVSEHPYGSEDCWVIKIDSMGNKICDKRFGGPGNNTCRSFIVMPDSSIYLCATADSGTSAVKTDAGKGSTDYWLVHFKYEDTTSTVGINPIGNENCFYVSPNPTKGILNYRNNLTGNAMISVFNLPGEKVYQNKIYLQKQGTLNFSSLQNGMYFLKIQNEKISSAVKFIKE